MPAGRPSKITLQVEDPLNPGQTISVIQAIVAYVEMGVWPGTAAKANGITTGTLANWEARGREVERRLDEGPYVCTEEEALHLELLEGVSRAEARGLAWHEANVRKAAASGKEAGGRLSLEFLARRQRAVYGRELSVQHGGTVKYEQIDEALDAEIADFLAANDQAREVEDGRGDTRAALAPGSEPGPAST